MKAIRNAFFSLLGGGLVMAIAIWMFGAAWSVPLPASAAPADDPTPAPTEAATDVVCVTSSDGDDICLTPADWLVLFEKIAEVTGTATAADAPATVATPAAPAADNGTVVTSDWTPAQKCEWLRMNFPQTTAQVQALGSKLANVPTERIATHIYHCDSETSVFDGFIVLGPNEGFSGAVTLTVPENGAIDSYPVECGARYSETPTLINRMPQNCDNTMRAVKGTVTSQRMSYWPWNDDVAHSVSAVVPAAAETPVATPAATVAAPTVAAPMPTEATQMACVDPVDLAVQKGWMKSDDEPDWADQKYGGLRVEIKTADTLPAGWEAQTSGRKITQNSEDRTMVPDYWSIYPPFSCRAELGYE